MLAKAPKEDTKEHPREDPKDSSEENQPAKEAHNPIGTLERVPRGMVEKQIMVKEVKEQERLQKVHNNNKVDSMGPAIIAENGAIESPNARSSMHTSNASKKGIEVQDKWQISMQRNSNNRSRMEFSGPCYTLIL